MIEIEKLKEFGLSENQAKLLNFIINSKHRSALTYKLIEDEFNLQESFYWELLDDLIKQEFLIITKETKPCVYQYDESRLENILKAQEDNYTNSQKKIEELIKELEQDKINEDFDLNHVFELLQTTIPELKLSMDKIYILNTLFSKENGKIVPIARSIRQIKEMISPYNGKLKAHNIRYYLNSLEKQGFISSRKDGRSKTYISKNLLTILKNEKKSLQTIWENKKSRLQDALNYINNNQISEDLKPQRALNNIYQLIDFRMDVVKWVKTQLINAKGEILLDFRLKAERNVAKLNIAKEFYNSFIEILNLREKSNLKVRLLMYYDSWVLQKLESLYTQLIQLISQGKLELKIPSESDYKTAKIIIDNSTLIDFMVKQDLAQFDKILLNKNELSVKNAKRQFERVWDSAIDIRDILMGESISNELENIIIESMTRNPPVYKFGKNPVIITGFRDVLSVNLNLLKAAESEVLILGDLLSVKKVGIHNDSDISYQRLFYKNLFKILIEKCRNGIKVKLLRNSSDANVNIIQDLETIKNELQQVYNLTPYLQMRQIEMPQYQFIIIDKQLLLIPEYLESGRIKFTFFTDRHIVEQFLFIFQNAWSNSLDFRLSWLSDQSKSLQDLFKHTLNDLELTISLPERGEMKVFDGKYTTYLVTHLLKINKNQVNIFQSFSEHFINNIENSEYAKTFADLVLSYGQEVINTVENKKMKARVILSYLPNYLNAISNKILKQSLDLHPRYQVHFLPAGLELNTIYGIYDNYVTLVIGDLASNNFQMLVINDYNLIHYYKSQFENTWNNTIDLRQIFQIYGSKKKKDLANESINKFKLEHEYSLEEIRKLFPPL